VHKNSRKLNSKKIFIIRHGETDHNKNGIVQGSGVNVSLNDKGRKQSDAFYSTYVHTPFDKIYTSTLVRSFQSVERFVEKGIPYEKLEGLNEINWGFKEGKSFSQIDENYYEDVLSKWQNGQIDYAIDGGESPLDVYNRQKSALKYVLSKQNEKLILICMHGRAMRIFLCLLLNYPIELMDIFDHQNLCLYKLTYTGHMFTIDAYNDVTHLNGL